MHTRGKVMSCTQKEKSCTQEEKSCTQEEEKSCTQNSLSPGWASVLIISSLFCP